MKTFDLNIEQVLEDWEVHHALRELIANAIDEQVLSATADIQITHDEAGRWVIRDFGRGLRYEHLTQNEDPEKLRNSGRVIGRFGVGLKDALATLDRRHVGVHIQSRYGDITLQHAPKHGFEDVVTLHALIAEPADSAFVGTRITLTGVSNEAMAQAQEYFLRFSGETVLERTTYGEVLQRRGETARIYVHGMLVAEEKDFLCSYNITSLTATMRKALNRERRHVGRDAYTDRVKAMLLACQSTTVAELLVKDLEAVQAGRQHDELTWRDVAVHACHLLNAAQEVVFVTAAELQTSASVVDHARQDGYRLVTLPDTVREKLRDGRDVRGQPMHDLSTYIERWNDSFQFTWVSPEQLTPAEQQVFAITDLLLAAIGGRPSTVRSIRISETMRLDEMGMQPLGLWEEAKGRIVIKRSELRSVAAYASVLLHEVAHARSGAADITRRFEQELTELLGLVAAGMVEKGETLRAGGYGDRAPSPQRFAVQADRCITAHLRRSWRSCVARVLPRRVPR